MAELVQSEAIKLAQTLHPRLLRLFTRWPPTADSIAATRRKLGKTDEVATETASEAPSPYIKTNPFKPWKNPSTGNWHGPHYSLRRQAELFKLAKEYNVMPLMPLSPKHPELKAQRRAERQGPMRTDAEGNLKVKGKKWERQLTSKIQKRVDAMVGMPKMIKEWRLTGNGKGWKKWPK